MLMLAISQRDSNFYEFLQDVELRHQLLAKLTTLFEEHIRPNFPDAHCTCDQFPSLVSRAHDLTPGGHFADTFDVYFARKNERAFIIDFNPYAPRTDSLLFSWGEIHRLAQPDRPQLLREEQPSFRVVTSPTQASQSMPSFSANRYPKEVVSLSDGASIAEFAQRWREALEEATWEDVSEKELEDMERTVAGR
jgi:hypothetical protein